MQSLADVLRHTTSSPASYISSAREIETLVPQELRPVRVSMLSSFTTEILRPYLIVEGARRGLRMVPHFCQINQIETQAFDSTSDLYRSEPDIIILGLRLEDVLPNLTTRYVKLSPTQIDAELGELQERIRALVHEIRQRSRAVIFVFNFSLPQWLDGGMADASLEVPQSSSVSRANESLAGLCRQQSATYVFDLTWLMQSVGLAHWCDSKLLYLARIPFGKEAQIALGRQLSRYVRAALFPPRKCLVLDLDNTLWGGVIGEDGLGGIGLGEDYPGNVFKAFQRRLLSLRDQGIALAIASKNNEADVVDVFANHPDMVLTLEDFSAVQIHWNEKAASLKAIAKELNIGLDALAFFDDSQIEREWVKHSLPEVAVIEAPTNPAEYIQALDESGAFDRLIISHEDTRRSEMIRESLARDQFRSGAASLDDFLLGLQMVAIVGRIGPATLPRVAQLLGKTNQFNLTTRRHTAPQLEQMLEGGAVALWMRLKDRFGDNGLVGVAIAVPEPDSRWRIDSFLLSCRVLGRQADAALLGPLAQSVRERGGRFLVGEYVPSPKNCQVADFYEAHGFRATDSSGQIWVLDLNTAHLALPEPIHIEYDSEMSHA